MWLECSTQRGEAEVVRGQIMCNFVGHSMEFGFDLDIEGS